MTALRPVISDAQGRVRREISIQRLLEWAFADECASIDFEDEGTLAQGYRSGFANQVSVLELGTVVDGGGRSYPDADADLVASALSVLPEGCGGRGMAVQIAELARARAVPSYFPNGVEWCQPVGWKGNRYGKRALTEHLEYVTVAGVRKSIRFDSRWCPVIYACGAKGVATARRNYLLWWAALLELRISFQYQNDMSRWVVNDDMPPSTPWKKVAAR